MGQRCQATTQTGQPCGAYAVTDSPYCFSHSPQHAEARALAHRKGGQGRRSPHMAEPAAVPEQIRDPEGVLALLDYAMRESLALPNGVQRNRILIALAAAYADALRTGELEHHLALLENLFAHLQSGRVQ